MKWKKSISIFVTLLILLISGCSNDSSNNSSSNSVDEQTTITFSFWGDPEQVKHTEEVIEKFEDENPDIKVDSWNAPWDNYFEKLQTRWAANESPDVMFLTDVPSYASKGVLKPLDDKIEEEGFELDNYNDAMLNAFEYEDDLYGLPRDSDTKVFFYNKKIFDDADIPYPEEGWTWDDLLDISEELTEKQNGKTTQYGVAFEPEWWRLWVWSNGGELFDDSMEPTETKITESQSVEAIEFLSDLMQKGLAPSYEDQSDSSKISQLFMSNQVAMAFGNMAIVPQLEDAEGLEWDVVGMPKVEGEEPVNNGGGAGYVVADQTEEFEASFKLWSFLQGEEGQKAFTEFGDIVPASKEAQKSEAFLGDKDYDAEVFIQETSHAYEDPPLFSEYAEVSQIINSELESVWVGETDAKESLKSVESEVNDVINE